LRNVKIAKAVDAEDFGAVVDAVSQAAKDSVKTAFDIKASLAADGRTDEDTAAEQEDKKLADMILTGIEAGAAALKTGKAAYDSATRAKIDGAAQEMVVGLGWALNDFLTTNRLLPPEVARAAGTAYQTATNAGLVAGFLIKGDPQKATEALAKGFADAFAAVNPDAKNPAFDKAGQVVAGAFRAALKGAEVKKAIDVGDFPKAVSLAITAATA